MQINYCEQGTQEWLDARSGYISASNGDVLLTPTGKPATGQKVATFTNKIIAERLMGKSAESGYQSQAMERGHEIEGAARDWYEMATGQDVTEVGLVTSGDLSCSPDGLILIGNDIVKGLEIKCPLASTHIGYLLNGYVPPKYIPQLQVSMIVTGVDKWDFLSYHPDLEPLLVTVARDDEWIDSFLEVSAEVVEKVLSGIEQIKQTKAA